MHEKWLVILSRIQCLLEMILSYVGMLSSIFAICLFTRFADDAHEKHIPTRTKTPPPTPVELDLDDKAAGTA